MSGLLWYGIFVALLCLSGIIFALLHVTKLIDVSRVHLRERTERSVDDDGLFTQLTPEQEDSLLREQVRLSQSKIRDARLRADLPPIQRSALPDEEIVEEEWIQEIHTGGKSDV